jgi:DNA modification methylase
MSLIQADARALPLRDGCVQCVVTSPPYFGLRDYGTATWEGGDPACDHIEATLRTRESLAAWSALHAAGGGHAVPGAIQYRGICGTCGATGTDKQIGLEATPDAYVAALVGVFRELRRVLKDDGVVWLNLGDSYNADVRKGRAEMGHGKNSAHNVWMNRAPAGTKPKDLLMIPARVALALQADGWYLRADVIWHKPNPMPESVTDRPTVSHEHLFLLAKAERYYYDAEAIKEPAVMTPQRRLTPRAANPVAKFHQQPAHRRPIGGTNPEDRNKRSVWTVPTQPYDGAHFATMPEALVEPCILAGSRLGDWIGDPFLGSGTVGAVAERLGRRWTGTDLTYQALARARTAQRGLRFAPVDQEEPEALVEAPGLF